ncbi:gas vesicle protein GvpG [Micromonospora sp. B11E3]|uniref:gas vesicle protein GvpG n=1 Tax=Micromonospora sp. B11E3 TaxID=3153562 RepID=UPI00325CD92D
MDILWTLLTLPYAPVRGVTAVVKVIAREAESRQRNPANIRRELEELDRAAAAGEITESERDRAQAEVLDRLTGADHPAPAGERRGAGDGGRRGTAAPVVRRPTGNGGRRTRRGR